MVNMEFKIKSEWITGDKGVTDEAVKEASAFAKELANTNNGIPLTTSQIRKFFGELKRIEADFDRKKDQIPLLKAKLAYAVGRNKKGNMPHKIEAFYKSLEGPISQINQDPQRFKRFVQIVEAIVAFHKFHGGKD